MMMVMHNNAFCIFGSTVVFIFDWYLKMVRERERESDERHELFIVCFTVVESVELNGSVPDGGQANSCSWLVLGERRFETSSGSVMSLKANIEGIH